MFRAAFLPIISSSYPCIGIGTFYAVLMTVVTSLTTVCYQEQDGTASSILLLVANGHQNCIKCTNADVRLRTPDDGEKGCPKHVES